MLWLEKLYIQDFALTVRNFKWKRTDLANCSCPICGDSHTNRHKARFYLFADKDRFKYLCHNCGAHGTFLSYLKTYLPETFQRYRYDQLARKPNSDFIIVPDGSSTLSIAGFNPLEFWPMISELPQDHRAYQYCIQRKIPNRFMSILRYADRFCADSNKLIGATKYKHTDPDEQRLIIPLIGADGITFAYQGRALDKIEPRYSTVVLDHSYPKVFGMNIVDTSEQFYCLEGPIDSMFVDNAIAMVGSDLDQNQFSKQELENIVFVFDNQPRNKEIVKKIIKKINGGHKVTIWPENCKEKDVNDMIINGLTPENINEIIKLNTFSGLEAQLRLNGWRKI